MKLKKFAAAALAAGMAAFGLSACQTAGNQPAPEDTGSVITQAPVEGATELNLWTFVELHGKFYTTMAEQWNELHPDKKVQIKVNALPYDDMHNKLQIALTSGTYHEATGKYLGTVDTSAAWATGLLLAQLGGEYFDAEGKINLTSPEMTQAMEIFKGLQDAGAAAVPPGGQPDTEEAFGAYNNGDFAAAVMPFWFTSRYLAYMPDFAGKIAIAPPPTVPNPKSISVGGGGTGTAVVKDGPHADLAAEFVAWAKLSKEGNIETWNMLGFDPLNTDVWSDEAVTHNPDNEFVKYFKNNPFEPLLEIKDSIGHLQSFTNPGMPAVNNMLNTQTFNDMFENNVPIADALAQAQADLENELG